MVYAYPTHVYRNGSAAAQWSIDRKVEAEYVISSPCALVRAVQYVLDCRFAHVQMISACVGRGVLLRVLGVFVMQ